ncbi:hypothetical protein C0993_005142 [Termitomyces sp. T159_Od127]|nr:hypothetical protein C0993_005142 [Termitomyces sp. T159_Od127]
MDPSTPQPPLLQGALQLPTLLKPLPGHPFDANMRPPPLRQPPPLCWAQRLPPGNSRPPLGGGSPNSGPLGNWGPVMDAVSPQHSGSNNYYYYYNAAPLPCNSNLQDNICNALIHEGKLNIQKLEPFHGHDPHKWRVFLMHCLTMFQAKPLIFQLENSHVAFAAMYLQGITFDHYTALLQFDPNSPVLQLAGICTRVLK